jgi:hypothetical protein
MVIMRRRRMMVMGVMGVGVAMMMMMMMMMMLLLLMMMLMLMMTMMIMIMMIMIFSRRADYSKDGAAAFEGCYTLQKREGEKRPPSFTDRILMHSLPDLK